MVSTGEFHSLGIKTDGTLWATGSSQYGQLGDGTNMSKSLLIQSGSGNSWQFVSGGMFHSLAIKTDGTLWAWGRNFGGQLGDGTNTDKNIPTQIGSSTNWKEISGGGSHSIGIKTDGTLWAWGDNNNGKLGIGSFTGSVNTPTQIGSASNWKHISCHMFHSLAIKTDGTLWAWGGNLGGQLGDGTNTDKNIPTQIGSASNWQSIETGNSHSLAIKTDGTLWAWGGNLGGQLGDGTNTDKNIPTQIGSNTNWGFLSGGNGHSLAIKTDGTLWAWGTNGVGQLGVGYSSTITINTPTQVGTSTNWQSISSHGHSFAIMINGSLWSWGPNQGALGIGSPTVTSINTPTNINCITANIQENNYSLNELNFYPNPTSTELNIQNLTDPLVNLSIIDATGKVVLEKKESGSKINVENLPKGIYLLKFNSEGKSYSSKFIKE